MIVAPIPRFQSSTACFPISSYFVGRWSGAAVALSWHTAPSPPAFVSSRCRALAACAVSVNIYPASLSSATLSDVSALVRVCVCVCRGGGGVSSSYPVPSPAIQQFTSILFMSVHPHAPIPSTVDDSTPHARGRLLRDRKWRRKLSPPLPDVH